MSLMICACDSPTSQYCLEKKLCYLIVGCCLKGSGFFFSPSQVLFLTSVLALSKPITQPTQLLVLQRTVSFYSLVRGLFCQVGEWSWLRGDANEYLRAATNSEKGPEPLSPTAADHYLGSARLLASTPDNFLV